jgi:hypothetical protein
MQPLIYGRSIPSILVDADKRTTFGVGMEANGVLVASSYAAILVTATRRDEVANASFSKDTSTADPKTVAGG